MGVAVGHMLPVPFTFTAEIDPLQSDGQGEDKGNNYRTGIYTHDANQAKVSSS